MRQNVDRAIPEFDKKIRPSLGGRDGRSGNRNESSDNSNSRTFGTRKLESEAERRKTDYPGMAKANAGRCQKVSELHR